MPWLVAILLGMFLPWKSVLSTSPANLILAFITIPLIFAYMVYLIWYAISIKEVFMESDHLLVSNYFRSTEIPLATIVKVVERKRPYWHPIRLHLSQTSIFGASIYFMPSQLERADDVAKRGLLARFRFQPNPIVAELNSLIKEACEQNTTPDGVE
jgi:hypothetical protein